MNRGWLLAGCLLAGWLLAGCGPVGVVTPTPYDPYRAGEMAVADQHSTERAKLESARETADAEASANKASSAKSTDAMLPIVASQAALDLAVKQGNETQVAGKATGTVVTQHKTETPQALASQVAATAQAREAAVLARAENTAYWLNLAGAIVWKIVLLVIIGFILVLIWKAADKLLEWIVYWVDEIVKHKTATVSLLNAILVADRDANGNITSYHVLLKKDNMRLVDGKAEEPTQRREDNLTMFEPADTGGNGHLLTDIEKVLELLEQADSINPDSNTLPSHGKMNKTAEWWNSRKDILERAGLVCSIPNKHTVLSGKWRTVGELLDAIEQGRANLKSVATPPLPTAAD